MNTTQKADFVRVKVRRHIKQINRWRGLNIGWKTIVKKLDLKCNAATLSKHYYGRGLI